MTGRIVSYERNIVIIATYFVDRPVYDGYTEPEKVTTTSRFAKEEKAA